ncbi:hypothetical protein [Streptomyces sp. NPDC059176]|uniref:hypothetical protein n=1 Tax=unclassified Streptomyces TaxID=2593676 RepID=UPI003674E242
MRTRTAITTIATATVLLLTACEPTTDSKPAATPSTAPSAAATEKTEAATLPNLVGKGLQSAQDEAQAAGFYGLTSHDALGRGRLQALDRNWKVCSQTPAPGTHPTDTRVDFGAVKLDEDCPAKDEGKQPEANGTMPNLIGKSVRVARQALPSNTSISVKDGTGQDRLIIVESNWKVCRIDPAAGAKVDGRPVAIDAVKFDEDC